MLIPLLFLLASAPQTEPGCPDTARIDAQGDEHLPINRPEPREASGRGLWIAGISFSPADIASATAKVSRMIPDQWGVVLTFTPSGNAKFIAAQRCRLNRQIEISLDNRVIAEPFLQLYIKGGEAEIYSGNQNQAHAREMARKIMHLRGRK
jgi:preprotein translocase subunit SecD